MSSPWLPRTLRTTVVAAISGAGLVIVGWHRVANTTDLGSQVLWLEIAVIAAIAGAGGALVWLVRGHRAVRERKQDLAARLGSWLDSATAAGPSSIVADGHVVAALRMSRFHRPGCALAAGRQVQLGTASSMEAAGLHPCGVCRP